MQRPSVRENLRLIIKALPFIHVHEWEHPATGDSKATPNQAKIVLSARVTRQRTSLNRIQAKNRDLAATSIHNFRIEYITQSQAISLGRQEKKR
ncbi:hypothetical protein NDU88_005531 [Pleurodeles waltl]|uniref:Uncharacterized protein n=1 Tax=Pleurodeles waltl TaxID=8319 RepID=A0AAV7MJN9_PLEWA|nr:hypothetical protein NDU88_005531 [Pleurodeles waltl]